MNARSLIALAMLAGLAAAAFAEPQLSKVDGGKQKQQNEAGQAVNKDSGPDSWQFWGPNRQLLNNPQAVNERAEATKGADYAGPDSWQSWNKQNEAGQRVNKDSGPDSWQFWGPNRQLLNKDTKGKSVNEAGNYWSGAAVNERAEATKGTDAGPDSWQFWNKQNEAGQRANKDSGPDSWQFWKPSRQMLSTGTLTRPAQKSVNEAGQRMNKDSGPDSWQFWGPNRQLLQQGQGQKEEHKERSVNERGGRGMGGGRGGNAGPDSWQFWAPQRQLLNQEVKPAAAGPQQANKAPVKTPESAPKQTAMKPTQPAQANAKPESAPKPAAKPATAPKQAAPAKPESAPKQAAPAKQPESAPKQQQGQQAPQQQQQAPQKQNERGFRGWAWGANSDIAGMPGGGQAYPLMNIRNIYSAAGWGGAPTTCAQGEFAHSCSTGRKLLLKQQLKH